MTYKGMILTALLTPICIATYSNDLDPQIQKLREDLYKKELELSDLGKKILEQEAIFSSYSPKLMEIYQRTIAKRRNSLNGTDQEKKIDDQEKTPILNSIGNDFESFLEKLIIFVNSDLNSTLKCAS